MEAAHARLVFIGSVLLDSALCNFGERVRSQYVTLYSRTSHAAPAITDFGETLKDLHALFFASGTIFLNGSQDILCALLSCLHAIFSLIPWRGDWPTIEGWRRSVGWPGCDVRVSQGARGSWGEYLSSGSALTSDPIHRWARSQTGNVTVVQSWDKTSASSLKLVCSSTQPAVRAITWGDVGTCCVYSDVVWLSSWFLH